MCTLLIGNSIHSTLVCKLRQHRLIEKLVISHPCEMRASAAATPPTTTTQPASRLCSRRKTHITGLWFWPEPPRIRNVVVRRANHGAALGFRLWDTVVKTSNSFVLGGNNSREHVTKCQPANQRCLHPRKCNNLQ